MQAIIEGNLYEVEPAVKVILDRLKCENNELKRENKRLEEAYQKATGVIAATDCAECKRGTQAKTEYDAMIAEWECDNCPVEQRERELTEVWQGYGTTITAPKGTFDKIFNDEEGEE